MIDAPGLKAARMTATRDYFANGSLEILDEGGSVALVSFRLSASGGIVVGPTWTLGFVANPVTAAANGRAGSAQLKTASGSADRTGLTVGDATVEGIQNVELDNIDIKAGQGVSLTSAQFTAG